MNAHRHRSDISLTGCPACMDEGRRALMAQGYREQDAEVSETVRAFLPLQLEAMAAQEARAEQSSPGDGQ